MNFSIAASVPTFDRELAVSRIIEAPPELVFKVWTEHLPEWWGPHGMITPFCEIDLRPGGVFKTMMRAPDGTEYLTRGVFLEVVKPVRLIYTDAFEPGWRPRGDAFFTSVTHFDSLPGKRTACTVQALHWTTAARDQHAQMGFHEVWIESLERLAHAVFNYLPLIPNLK